MQKLKKMFVTALFWSMILLAGFFVWKNPEIATRTKKAFVAAIAEPSEAEIKSKEEFARKIEDLQNKLYQLEQKENSYPDHSLELAELEKKFSTLEANNLNIINSKADVATVLGVVTRIDEIDTKLSKIAKVSDQGALVLMAAMLVKEQADKGDSFEYEAEVLSQIAEKEISLKKEIDEVIKLSAEGVATNYQLIKELERLQIVSQEIEPEISWKERLMAKFREIVQVKKANEIIGRQKESLEEARLYLEKQQLSKALDILEQDQRATVLKKKIEDRVSFDRAISRISAYSLALMKVNALQKGE